MLLNENIYTICAHTLLNGLESWLSHFAQLISGHVLWQIYGSPSQDAILHLANERAAVVLMNGSSHFCFPINVRELIDPNSWPQC